MVSWQWTTAPLWLAASAGRLKKTWTHRRWVMWWLYGGGSPSIRVADRSASPQPVESAMQNNQLVDTLKGLDRELEWKLETHFLHKHVYCI